jgi:hypothetical protein
MTDTEHKPAEDQAAPTASEAMSADQKERLQAAMDRSQDDYRKIMAHVHQRLGEAFAAGDHVCRYFGFAHLPPKLQPISMSFASLAVGLLDNLPRNPERTVALRKLLEAKDAAVRAALP